MRFTRRLWGRRWMFTRTLKVSRLPGTGLGVGAFFITPWIAMNYAYSMRNPRLIAIDGGYAILGCGVIGLVLGLF